MKILKVKARDHTQTRGENFAILRY